MMLNFFAEFFRRRVLLRQIAELESLIARERVFWRGKEPSFGMAARAFVIADLKAAASRADPVQRLRNRLRAAFARRRPPILCGDLFRGR